MAPVYLKFGFSFCSYILDEVSEARAFELLDYSPKRKYFEGLDYVTPSKPGSGILARVEMELGIHGVGAKSKRSKGKLQIPQTPKTPMTRSQRLRQAYYAETPGQKGTEAQQNIQE